MSGRTNSPTRATVRHWLAEHLWLLLPLFFAAMILLFYPFRFVFEFNPDEGLHLMRSLLYSRGYELYVDIYNDQPPLFTLLLSALFSLTDFNVTLGRLVSLGLSLALMYAALAYLRSHWGQPHAIGAWLLFLLLPQYRQLSVSVMISLPAVALGTVSFYALTRWHRTRSTSWLVLSAVILALSVMTKAFTGILAPIIGVGLLASEFRRRPAGSWWQKLRPAFIWSLVFTALVVGIALIAIGPPNLPQLIRVHLSAREADQYLELRDTHTINYVLRDARGFLLLAVFGALVALAKREWTALYLIAWASLGYAGLSLVLPVWAHHQMLVTIPALMLAAILLGEIAIGLADRWRARGNWDRRFALHSLGLVAALVILGLRIPWFFAGLNPRLPNLRYTLRAPDIRQYKILALMWKHADETQLVVTDRPMYAFRIKKPVPPELAVISEKRLWSGSITQEQIVRVIEVDRPEQVLLIRFPLSEVEAYLDGSYSAIYRYGPWRLYLRNDLAAGPEPGVLAAPTKAELAAPD